VQRSGVTGASLPYDSFGSNGSAGRHTSGTGKVHKVKGNTVANASAYVAGATGNSSFDDAHLPQS
jgi:hypothetical protein